MQVIFRYRIERLETQVQGIKTTMIDCAISEQVSYAHGMAEPADTNGVIQVRMRTEEQE